MPDPNINRAEQIAFKDAAAVADDHGASVHLHTKLTDLVDPAPGDDFDWSTRAHIDLIVRDDENGLQPLIAIEVDGRSHTQDAQTIYRDRLKDALLRDAGIDVVRVKADAALRLHGKDRMTAYLLTLWFASRAFHQAKEEGDVAYDESFFHPFMFTVDEGTGRRESLDPTARIRGRLYHDSAENGIPVCWIPQGWHCIDPITTDTVARVILPLTEAQFLFAEAVVAGMNIPGVRPGDIAEQLALEQIEADYDAWLSGDATARRASDLDSIVPQEAVAFAPDGSWRYTGSSSLFADWMRPILGSDRTVRTLGGSFE